MRETRDNRLDKVSTHFAIVDEAYSRLLDKMDEKRIEVENELVDIEAENKNEHHRISELREEIKHCTKNTIWRREHPSGLLIRVP